MLAADWLVISFKCFQSNNLKMGFEKTKIKLEAIPDISLSFRMCANRNLGYLDFHEWTQFPFLNNNDPRYTLALQKKKE